MADRRSEMAARAKSITQGAAPGEADVRCRGDRLFPVARKDTALVIIDMQTDFISPEGRIGKHYKDSTIRSGLQGVERLLAAARKSGLTVAHSRSHRYGSDIRDDLVGTDDEGYAIYPSLAPQPGEIVVDKWTFGAFASTPLEEELRARGVQRILLCGVCTNVCVFATAVQAVDRFIRVCLVEDACAGFTQEWHDRAISLISEPQQKKGHNAQLGLYFGEVASVKDVETALAPLDAPNGAPSEKKLKPTPIPTPGRRAEMAARAKSASRGAAPGEADVRCRGDRLFPVARKDTALVIIDMQTDFLSHEGRIGKHYKDSTIRSGLQGVERLLAASRKSGLTVAHSRSHRYGSDIRDDLVGTDDEGYAVYPSLAPQPGEIVVDKWTFGAFASTPLEEELRARGVERILLCGVCTNVCVFATASQAVDRFIRVCLVEDACAGFTQEWHDKAVSLISETQQKKGHNSQLGLYFGEVASVQDVETALAPLRSN